MTTPPTTYVVTKLNVFDTVYDVGISVQHKGKFKIFESQLSKTSEMTNFEAVTTAWTLLKDDVNVWIARIDVGDDLTGVLFTPQEDGTLVFSSN